MRFVNSWQAVLAEHWRAGGFGLYIHWPFCQAKCPYCDFNSHVVSAIDQRRWQAAYLSEIERVGQQTDGRILKSVFFGGGTPSLMDPEVVDAIIAKVRATWPMSNDIEITLEANPTSVETNRFAGYRDAGVNRVSLGVQALNDADLKALGRLHSADEARAAFDIARNVFERVSFDLIYARQNQSPDQWDRELQSALDLAVDHLSLYQLTIEEGTAFGSRHATGKLVGLPEDDTAADMYDITQAICSDAGFPAYEVSNHAKSGEESKHNLIYWRAGDYAGIGPGAHGRLTLDEIRYATDTPLMPFDWLKRVEQTGSGQDKQLRLDDKEQLSEFLLMGLRLVDGVDITRLAPLLTDEVSTNVEALCADGWLIRTDDSLKIAPHGRPILNAVLREVLK